MRFAWLRVCSGNRSSFVNWDQIEDLINQVIKKNKTVTLPYKDHYEKRWVSLANAFGAYDMMVRD